MVTVGKFRFENLRKEGLDIFLNVVHIEQDEFTHVDIRNLLRNMGKWELLRNKLSLIIELLPVDIPIESTENPNLKSGTQMYDVSFPLIPHDGLVVEIGLKREERRRREADESLEDISVEEIQTKLENLRKWESLKEFKELIFSLTE
jgi:hypothetical protein